MSKNIVQLGSVILSILMISSCGANTFNDNITTSDNYSSLSSTNRISEEFVKSIENDEVLIDEQYYKKYPDQKLATEAISQIKSGQVPNYTPSLKNDIQSQGLFNHKAEIDIYDSYGTQAGFTISGRVFERKNTVANVGDSKLTNLIKNIRTFIQDPIKNVDVNINIGNISKTVRTDNKGFYKVSFEATGAKPGNVPVIAKLLDSKYKADSTQGEVLIEDINSDKLSVITDIDDTIKYSAVDHKIQLIKNIFLGNYTTDKPIAGVSTMYNGILKGPQGTGFDSVHYVTGSYIQLDGRLEDFIKYNKFPLGSLNLKRSDQDPSDIMDYKLSKIRPIMKAFPNKKFVMFGDAIQKDPELYTLLKHEFPGRVAGIYIRNTKNETPDSPRYKEAMLTNSAIDAAQDLFKNGYISQNTLNQVISEVKS